MPSTELPAVKPLDIYPEHTPPQPPFSQLSPQYLLEAVVLLAVGAVPAVAIPIWHHRVLVAEPAVHCHVRGLLPGRKRNVASAPNLADGEESNSFQTGKHKRAQNKEVNFLIQYVLAV